MRITVIGGGNVGTLIGGQLSYNKHQVTIYTRNIDKWSNELTVHDKDTDKTYKSKVYKITDNLSESIKDAEFIIVTLPAFALPDFILKLEKINLSNTILCFYPGTGGGELLSSKLIQNNVTVCGVQRIASVARLYEYGHSVYTSGKRDKLYIGCIPHNKGEYVRKIFSELFEIETELLPNYLNVTLTPSNPILHTSRLYCIFKDYNDPMEKIPLFYEDWNDESSQLLIDCDNELHEIIKKLDKINLLNVKPLLEHYESYDAVSLTEKIRSIKGFKGIVTPNIKTEFGYIPDLNSRYFTADFPFGLLIIKDFALITNTLTPNIDKLILWYQKLVNKEYITLDGKLGRDSYELTLPENYGIDTIDKVTEFYLEGV